MGTKWNGKDLTWLTETNDVTGNCTSHGIWTSTKVCPIPLSLLMNYKLSKSIWQNQAGSVVVHLSGSSLVQQQDVEMNRSLSCNHDDVRWTHRRHKWIPCLLFQTHESLIIHPASLGLPQIYKSVLHSAYIYVYTVNNIIYINYHVKLIRIYEKEKQVRDIKSHLIKYWKILPPYAPQVHISITYQSLMSFPNSPG